MHGVLRIHVVCDDEWCMASQLYFTEGLSFFYATLATIARAFTTTIATPFAVVNNEKNNKNLFFPSNLLAQGIMESSPHMSSLTLISNNFICF